MGGKSPPAWNYGGGELEIITGRGDVLGIKRSRKCFKEPAYPLGRDRSGRLSQLSPKSCGSGSLAPRKSSLQTAGRVPRSGYGKRKTAQHESFRPVFASVILAASMWEHS